MKKLLFFEIGIFEVGFVVILLAIIFFVLNYFNILKLSANSTLSFLPHLPNSLGQNAAVVQPSLVPTDQAENQLRLFLSQTLQENFQTTTPLVFQTSASSTRKDVYTSWTTSNTFFTANQEVKWVTSAYQTTQNLSIFLGSSSALLTAADALEKFQQYFKGLNNQSAPAVVCHAIPTSFISTCTLENRDGTLPHLYQMENIGKNHKVFLMSCRGLTESFRLNSCVNQ